MSNVAKKNERVKVNRDFSIIVPEGYTYSAGSEENIKIVGVPQQLVFFKTEMNDIYIDKYSEDAEFNFEEPFMAPRCLVVSGNQTGLRLDLSDSKTRKILMERANGFNMMSTKKFTIKETDDILVYYFAAPEGPFPNSFFTIICVAFLNVGSHSPFLNVVNQPI